MREVWICILGNWHIISTIYDRFLYSNQIVKKIKKSVLFGRYILYFPSQTLTFNRAALNGNITLSVVVLWTKKRYSSFLRKGLVLPKPCFKVKVFKAFQSILKQTFQTFQSKRFKTFITFKITQWLPYKNKPIS